jgi:DNA-binding transcriptional LysR family regulator
MFKGYSKINEVVVMEFKLLEDFVALAETGSFSKAATIRHVTQPAFSRRIKTLESWFGVTLIDRSHYPTKLTPEGESLYQTAKRMVDEIYQCREDVRVSDKEESSVLRFAMPHNLSMAFFPSWRSQIEHDIGSPCIKIATGNIHDSAQLLDSGNCDFVLYFECQEMPSSCFNGNDFVRLKVGNDKLLPVTKSNKQGGRMFDLDTGANIPVPYLAWGQPTLAEHAVSALIDREGLGSKIRLRYQNQLAAALRAEVLLGNGIAWLSESIIREDLSNGDLVYASSNHVIPIDIFIVKKQNSENALVDMWWKTISTSYVV